MENKFMYICETCNYNTNDWSNYDKHNLTKKDAKLNKANVEFIYICEPCEYKTNDYSCFEGHKKTKKHQRIECYTKRGEWKKYSDRGYNARGWIIKERHYA